MARLLQGLLRSLPTPGGLRLDRRLRMTNTRRVQFASYLESSGGRARQVDGYERSLQRRRWGKRLLGGGLALGLAWVLIESARAVTLF